MYHSCRRLRRPEAARGGAAIHGISEHIGRYDSFARFLAEHGFAVVGHDHLGHGRTARNPWSSAGSPTGTAAEARGEGRPHSAERLAEYPRSALLPAGPPHGPLCGATLCSGWHGGRGYPLSRHRQEPPATVAAGRALSALLIRLKGPRAHSAPAGRPLCGAVQRPV